MTQDNCTLLLRSSYDELTTDNNNRNKRRTTAPWGQDGGGGWGVGAPDRFRRSVLLLAQDRDYDDLARNIDANLAEIDIEHFRSEDIESILALPVMCRGCRARDDDEQDPEEDPEQEEEEEEEDSEDEEEDMSVCRSGSPLFSPLKEKTPATFSVDSLDCSSYDEHELLLTCRANKNNYTIAFEARYSDDSDYHEEDADADDVSRSRPRMVRCRNRDSVDSSLVRSDEAKGPGPGRPRGGGGGGGGGRASKSRSLPNLFGKTTPEGLKVPLFSVAAKSSSSSGTSDLSLVRLFVRGRARGDCRRSAPTLRQDLSAMYRSDVVVVAAAAAQGGGGGDGAGPIEEADEEADSSGEDVTVLHRGPQPPVPDARPSSRSRATQTRPDTDTGTSISRSENRSTQIPVHVSDEAVQTSSSASSSSCGTFSGGYRWVERAAAAAAPPNRVYVCYPNYSLPDLQFLRASDAKAHLARPETACQRACEKAADGLPKLSKDDVRRIQDLESLCVLLPTDVRDALTALRSPDDREALSPLRQLFVYDYGGGGDDEGPPPAPPLPKRSISLPDNASSIRPDGGEMLAEAGPSAAQSPVCNPQPKDRGRELVGCVISAVQTLVAHFSTTTDAQEKFALGSSILCPASGHLVVDNLCPALGAVLDDGLLPQLYSLFGRIANSVWKVVETCSRTGVTSRALNDLVARLNGEKDLEEKQKFNAFVIGLLNIRSVDSWLAFLRGQHSIVRQHYDKGSFLFRSNGALKPLFDDLLKALQPLAVLPFDLDLVFEKLHSRCLPGRCCCCCPFPFPSSASSCSSSSSASLVSPLSLYSPPLPVPVPVPAHCCRQQRSPSQARRPLQRGTSRDSAVGTSCSATSTLCEQPDVLQAISEEDARAIRRWSAAFPAARLTADFLTDVRLATVARKPGRDDDDKGGASATEEASSGGSGSGSGSGSGEDVAPRDFKRLQKKWEMLSAHDDNNKGKGNNGPRSRIPRLVTTTCSPPNRALIRARAPTTNR